MTVLTASVAMHVENSLRVLDVPGAATLHRVVIGHAAENDDGLDVGCLSFAFVFAAQRRGACCGLQDCKQGGVWNVAIRYDISTLTL